MGLLGRGLASLIPKGDESAEDVLARIDRGDPISPPDEQEASRGKRTVSGRSKKIAIQEEDADVSGAVEAAVESDLPPKPLVTPLTIDPDGHVQTEIPPAPVIDVAEEEKVEGRLLSVPIEDIVRNTQQPRRHFDQEKMDELARSLDAYGLLQPIVVQELGDGKYELIAGERRLRAAKQLKWERLPCVVRKGTETDRSKLELALLENLQRRDLNPIEEAIAFKQLTTEYGMGQDDIAKQLGRSRVAVTNSIRMLNLPAEVQQGLIEGKIGEGHARAILMVPSDEKRVRFYRKLVEEKLTVRKAEVRARRIQRKLAEEGDEENQLKSDRTRMSRLYTAPLEQRFGFATKITFDKGRGKFEITFVCHSIGEVEELVSQLMKSGAAQPVDDLDED